jgi:hypothetical protein
VGSVNTGKGWSMMKYMVKRLPNWLIDNMDFDVKIGDIVTRVDLNTFRLSNGKLIRLGVSYCKEI